MRERWGHRPEKPATERLATIHWVRRRAIGMARSLIATAGDARCLPSGLVCGTALAAVLMRRHEGGGRRREPHGGFLQEVPRPPR
jgi:hypothetical protein